ncbi:hypothetical protein NON08_10455 [Cetobacterium somerae]|uniref:hypothetical protein n=1 Tax=Cetobacterium sp. NK01 TaxID=2993530 RepID=UPI0021166B62|nr:hypothetical protein [Cetobacterium sp. NK01]MCQ8212942.1 hypothetical protein [Cetobacterium sp. NK01]
MKKALVIFKSGDNLDLIIESCLSLKKEFGFEITPVYALNVNPFINNSEDEANLLEDFSELQDDFLDKTKEKLIEHKLNAHLLTIVQVTTENLKNLLRLNDLLVYQEGLFLGDLFLEILKTIYRPIIVLRGKPLSFENICITSDDGIKVNKSVYNFLSLFSSINLEKIDVFTWDYKKQEHTLLELIHDKGVLPHLRGYSPSLDSIEDFYFELNKSSLLIMGNLSHSFFLEKITNRMGLNILEHVNTPIFIA